HMPQPPRLRPCRPPVSPRSPSAPPADATSPPSHSPHGPSNGRGDENSSCAIALFIVVFKLPCGRELHGIFLSPRAMLDLFRHGRLVLARPGHPRLSCLIAAKTWMPGTMGLCSGRRSRTRVPGMTILLGSIAAPPAFPLPHPPDKPPPCQMGHGCDE